MPEELIRSLGFKVHNAGNGQFLIERLDENGKARAVVPILHPEVWDLWKLVEAQSEVIRALPS